MRTQQRQRRLLRLIVGALVVCLFASGCSNTPLNPSSDNNLLRLAETMPAPDHETFFINFVDYELFADQAGIGRPGSCAGAAERSAYLDDLFDVILAYPIQLIGPEGIASQSEEIRAAYGYDLCDVRAGATPSDIAGFGPLNVSHLLVSVDTDDIASAVASDPEWSSLVSTRTVSGVEIYDWGSRPKQGGSLIRPLGIGGQLAVSDAGIIVHSRSSDDMGRILDSDVARLIDLPHVRQEMTNLTDAGAYTVLLSNWSLPASLLEGRGSVTEFDIAPLVPWELLVEGHRIEGGGFVTQMVFLHGSAEDAQTNAVRLQSNYENGTSLSSEQPLTERFELLNIDVNNTRVIVTTRTDAGTITSPGRSHRAESMFLIEG